MHETVARLSHSSSLMNSIYYKILITFVRKLGNLHPPSNEFRVKASGHLVETNITDKTAFIRGSQQHRSAMVSLALGEPPS